MSHPIGTTIKPAKSFLEFTKIKDTGKTSTWIVNSADSKLGYIAWHSPWRRYVYYPDIRTLYDASCMTTIVEFINNLMKDRKQTDKVIGGKVI